MAARTITHFSNRPSGMTIRSLDFKIEEIAYERPLDVFSKLVDEYDYVYLLESVTGPQKLAEFSFIGFDPRIVIRVKDGKAEIRGEKKDFFKTNDPLEIVKEEISTKLLPLGYPRFTGGAVGYISYDAVRYWEHLSSIAVDDLKLPDLEMGIYDDGIVFEHSKRKAYYFYTAENRLSTLERKIKSSRGLERLRFSRPKPNIRKEEYEEIVAKAKEYVFNGDIFQVVLSKRYSFNINGDFLRFYQALRRINPSPYMYFLKHDDTWIIGSSPEMLVRVEGKIIETYPIAGTRQKTGNPKRDEKLARELLADPKERAEHVMLVDLARNDLGRVAEYGSVKVPDFMVIHRYSHVQHIVSRVVGVIAPDKDCFDVLRTMLPAGTVSGAPKVRAMEIIEELEPTRRGPYAGAVGYFSYNGNADFAITIRTLVVNKKRGHIQVGAGVVADSIPEREWFETEHKARALLKALNLAGDEK
ncbi:MAG: anthranilate synthase component I [Crenarchaeota archaeon]|nr:anthranilate synthase component I [Thermoproteota archaeon]MDW8033384.1 anthranilate synthase component I [Nitrososphaerota archaeon]